MTEKERQQVVFVIPKLYRAGAERVLHEVVSGLNHKKYALHIICFYKTESYFKFRPEIKIHYLFNELMTTSRKNSLGKVVNLLRGAYISLKLVQYLSKFPKGSLIVPFIEFNALKVAPAKFLYGHRIIARPASTGSAYIQYHFKHRWRQRIEKLLLKLDFGSADKIVVQSEGVKNDYLTKFSVPAKKLCVIWNPVNLSMIEKKCKEPVKLDSLLKSSITVFSHVGRLVEKKNHQLLIAAAERLKHRYSDFIILCAGAGHMFDPIQEEIRQRGLEKHLILVGDLENPFSLMAASRAMILTSTHESFSIVLVEAMASGAAVIATDCPYGPAEVLDNGEFGILVAQDDPSALADAMYSVATDDVLFDRLRSRGLERSEVFDINNIIKKWEKCIDRECAMKEGRTG